MLEQAAAEIKRGHTDVLKRIAHGTESTPRGALQRSPDDDRGDSPQHGFRKFQRAGFDE